MLSIKNLRAASTLDSRGQPTVSVSLKTDNGKVEASVPRGKSKGKYEVSDISEKGINYSINFINKISKDIQKLKIDSLDDVKQISVIVKRYDKTPNLRVVGGNSLLAIEIVLAKSLALHNKLPLWKLIADSFHVKPRKVPAPLGNCIGGGKHSLKQIKPDIQEFLIWPKAKTFSESFSINTHVYMNVEKLLKYGYGRNVKARSRRLDVTDEHAFCPSMDNIKVLELLQHIKHSMMASNSNHDINFGLDIAASSLWNNLSYVYKNFPGRKEFSNEQQLKFVADIIEKYNLKYVEDPFIEDDFDYFSMLNLMFNKKRRHEVLIVGDDLIATNPDRLEKAIKMESINAVIVKPNQAGSLFKAKQVVDIARKHDVVPVVSHRSAETLDDWLADFAVGCQAPLIKAGISGKERLVKLLRLVRIEREMKKLQ